MKIVEKGECVFVQLSGRLDAVSSSKLKKQLTKIRPDQHSVCILDMDQVDFIDSEGVCTLVHELKRLNQVGCRLAICNLHSAARLIFEITQLDQVFEIIEGGYDAVYSTQREFQEIQPLSA